MIFNFVFYLNFHEFIYSSNTYVPMTLKKLQIYFGNIYFVKIIYGKEGMSNKNRLALLVVSYAHNYSQMNAHKIEI